MTDRKFEVERRWRGLRGLAFGLQQPVLIGRAAVGQLTAADLERLEERAWLSPGIRLLPFDPRADLARRFVFRLLDWVGALQRQAGIPVSERVHLAVLGRSTARPDHQVMRMAVPAPAAVAARAAIQWVADQLPLVLGEAQPGSLELKDLAWLQSQLAPYREPGMNRFHIVQAAHRLDIPAFALTNQTMAFGSGDCMRLMISSTTDSTPNIGVRLAASKSQTATVLRLAGLPGALHLPAHSADEAVAAAVRLGYPVVVKPDDQEQGRGVQANLVRPEQVSEAWTAAMDVSKYLLVERWVDGSTHRLTVFQGRVIRVVKRQAGGVIGDGVLSVAALVEQQSERARDEHQTGLQGTRPVSLDAEALDLLQQSALSPSHVPAEGVHVRLRRRDNINAGGLNVEIALDTVHPDNLRLAVDAAALLRLDFAGIDLISLDIAQSWLDNGATICEVNAVPQMGVGGDPKIYEKVLLDLMGGRARSPVQLVLCPADPTLRAQALDQCLASSGAAHTAVSDTSGLWLRGQRVTRPFKHGFDAARALLLRRDVTQALCLMSVDEVIGAGFPLPQVDALTVALQSQLAANEQAQIARVFGMVVVARGADTQALPTPTVEPSGAGPVSLP